MKKTRLALGMAALLASFGANALTIDLFTTEQFIKDFTAGGGGVEDSATGLDMLGGERDIWANYVSNSGSVTPGSGTSVAVGSGILSFANDSGVAGQGRVQWDGEDNSIALDAAIGLGGIDITMGGALTGFLLTTISSDAAWNFEISLYSGVDAWTQISFAATEVPTGTGPVNTVIPFAGFTSPFLCGSTNPVAGVNFINCGTSLVDLTQLTAIDVLLNTGANAQPIAFDIDLRIGTIGASVPEPGTLALLGIGLFGAGFLRQRASKR